MAKTDRRVDAYINRAPMFARPILNHLRKIVHKACPDVEETIKWGSPFFERKGIICFMASFKEHAVFGFWKGAFLFGKGNKGAMGHFGRITSLKDLPDDKELVGFVRKAAELNERVIEKKRRPRGAQRVTAPNDLRAALAKNAKARKTFENFSYSHKKEYVDWIADAKRDETRRRRLRTALQWLSKGKPQNWRYM